MPPPTAIYHRAALLIGVGWVIVSFTVAVFFDHGRGPNVLAIGLAAGTLLQFSLLAGTWCVLGPAPLMWRMPLSFAWAVVTGFVMIVPEAIQRTDPTLHITLIICATLWLVVQLPLWALALGFRLRLRHQGTPADETGRQSQFGIGQLLAFTTFVAVLLTCGRLLLAYHQEQKTNNYFEPDWVFPAVLVTAQVLVGLPLILASLLPRYAVPSVVVCLVLVAIVSAAEVQIIAQVVGGAVTPPPEMQWVFVAINAFSSCWTLAFAGVVRRSGYHFGVPTVESLAAYRASEGAKSPPVPSTDFEPPDLSHLPPRPPL